MFEIDSERLRLRDWRLDDFEPLARYFAEPDNARFLGGTKTRDVAWRHMAMLAGHWALRGFGIWALEEKRSGDFVGAAGLWYPEGWPEIEIGYWLLPAAQGRGFATEAVLRARQYAYEVLGLETAVSYIHPDNEASKKVAERAGARMEGTIELPNYGSHCLYRHPANKKGQNEQLEI